MDNVLLSLCDQVATATGLSVKVGRPGSSDAQIVLWPWHISSTQSRQTRNLPRGQATVEMPITLSFFVLSENRLDSLLQAAASLARTPILDVDGVSYQVTAHEISQEGQVAVFAAAKLAPQPALSYTLGTSVTIGPRWVSPDELPIT